MSDYTKEDLREALRSIESTVSKCEKVQPKLKQGSPQHSLLARRLKAFMIVSDLIRQVLNQESSGGIG